jgi:ubiquitin carboxyl-terminal hydrolase 5/13
MASVLQALFALPAFQNYYYPSDTSTAPAIRPTEHWRTCAAPLPATCVDCQMLKLADGLLSGRYSHPRSSSSRAFLSVHLHDSHSCRAIDSQQTNPLAHDSPTPVFQESIRPSTFKALVGRGHAEFATMRQQDAEEFLAHLLAVLRRHAHAQGAVTSRSFRPRRAHAADLI